MSEETSGTDFMQFIFMQNQMFVYLFIYEKDFKGFAKTTTVPHECPG